MPKKIIIRRDDVKSSSNAIFKLEKMIKDQYNEIWKEHIEDLEEMAEYIEEDAKNLAPVYVGTEILEYKGGFFTGNSHIWCNPKIESGLLKKSIEVKVSRSRRYPGIIAKATAKNTGKHFDYALIQEEQETFFHTIGEAHYLSQPFYNNIASYLEDYGLEAEIPEGLEDYLEE